MLKTITSIKKETIAAIAGLCLMWSGAAAFAAQVTGSPVDMHGDGATVPVWVFGTTLVSAIIFTVTATWHITRGFTKLEHKIETLEGDKQERDKGNT